MPKRSRSCGVGGLAVVLLAVVSAVPSFGHSDRPEPILRIDRRLASASERPLARQRESRLLVERASFSRLSGDARAALADLDRALALGAAGRRVDYERGLTLAMLGRDPESLVHLDRFIASGRANAPSLNARAAIHERAGRLEAAATDYQRSLERRADIEVYLDRGRLLEKLERCDDAARNYRMGLAALDDSELLARALVRSLVACRRYDQALATITARMQAGRARGEWLLLRGDVLEAAGDSRAAREAREQALANAEQALARRKTAILYYERARAHAALGNLSQARADVERVLEDSRAFSPALELAKALDVATASIPARDPAQASRTLEARAEDPLTVPKEPNDDR